jgi:tripartite-type tricarboxylate transporter receptor subunit TctC
MRKSGSFLCWILVSFALLVLPSHSYSAAPYYEGKVITIIVGYPAGGGYDLIARVLAKHLPKYIPGRPAVIIQNMPGASSMIAANHVYNRVKPDGLTLFATARNLAFMQLLKVEGVRFDMSKFSWIGSAAAESIVLCTRTTLPYKTIQDVTKSKDPLFLGVTGPADITTQITHITKDYIPGLKVNIVEYHGAPEIWLAIERKECDGVWIAYNSGRQYIDKGLVRPLVRARVAQKGIENLPVNEDLAVDPTGKTIMAMMGRTGVMGRLYLAPPATPPNVMAILNEAFDKTLKDPELQAEADKAHLELKYISGEECLKLLEFMFSQPAEIQKIFGTYMKF